MKRTRTLIAPKALTKQRPHWNHNRIYAALGRGEIEAVKDGYRTLIVLESVDRAEEQMPTYKPRSQRWLPQPANAAE
jgi:hypothetical protein